MEQWAGLSLDDALVSENPIVRALSMVDRRLGKRRLRQIDLTNGEHPLVRMLFRLRCDAERLT